MIRPWLALSAALLIAGCNGGGEDSAVGSPPIVSLVRLEPEEIFEATTVTCVPSGWFDPDGQPEGYLFRWLVNDQPISDEATLDGASFDKGDTVACEVTPDDGTLLGEPLLSAPSVVLNTPPRVPVAVLDPDPPSRAEPVTVQFPGQVDDDGDALVHTVRWYVNGAEVSSEASLSTDLFARNDAIYAVVNVSDGESEDQLLVTETSTVGNALPRALVVELGPDGARSTDMLTVSYEIEDADGDNFSVSTSWFVNNQQISASGETLDGAQWLNRGDVVYAVVTARDSVGTGPAKASNALTIANAPPETPVVDISPERPGESLWPIVCEPELPEDPDGDALTLTVRWERNGEAYTNTNTTDLPGDTIPAGALTEGDTWTCFVAADDGMDPGDEGSRTVTVGPAWEDLLVDGRTMNLSSGTYEYATITVINGSFITVNNAVTLRARTIEIDASSTIDGVGHGYRGGSEARNGNGTGAGSHGGSTLNGSHGGSGAGHGGAGGDGGYDSGESVATGGGTQGSEAAHDNRAGAGGGGGGTQGGDGGDGGSALTLNAETITIEGTIDLSGTRGTASSLFNAGGGGAGGGLLIECEELNLGSQTSLLATGGDGGDGNAEGADGGGGGGGGRIKIFYESNYTTYSRTVLDASGGAGGVAQLAGTASGQGGAAGTISILQEEYEP